MQNMLVLLFLKLEMVTCNISGSYVGASMKPSTHHLDLKMYEDCHDLDLNFS